MVCQPRAQMSQGVIAWRNGGRNPIRMHHLPLCHLIKKRRFHTLMGPLQKLRLSSVGRTREPQRLSATKPHIIERSGSGERFEVCVAEANTAGEVIDIPEIPTALSFPTNRFGGISAGGAVAVSSTAAIAGTA